MRTLLVVLDGSDRGLATLEHAIELYPGTRFVALRVVDPATRPDEYLAGTDALKWLRRGRSQGHEQLAAAEALGADRGVPVSGEVAYGRRAEQVVERSQREDIDGVVVGVDEEKDSDWPALIRLLRRIDRPTTLLRIGDHSGEANPPDSVLVPTDGSPQAAAALDHACDVFSGASITVLNVMDVIPWTVSDVDLEDDPEWNESTLEDWRATTRERSTSILEAARRRAENRESEIRGVSRTGLPVPEILEFVIEEGIDHVCMGRTGQGQRRLERILLGCTTEGVLRSCDVPVTVVPPASE